MTTRQVLLRVIKTANNDFPQDMPDSLILDTLNKVKGTERTQRPLVCMQVTMIKHPETNRGGRVGSPPAFRCDQDAPSYRAYLARDYPTNVKGGFTKHKALRDPHYRRFTPASPAL